MTTTRKSTKMCSAAVTIQTPTSATLCGTGGGANGGGCVKSPTQATDGGMRIRRGGNHTDCSDDDLESSPVSTYTLSIIFIQNTSIH